MTDEEMAKARADKFADINFNEPDNYGSEKEIGYFSYYTGFLAGLKTGRPQWHKIADGDLPKGDNGYDDGYSKTSIHRKIYLKDRHGNLYTGRYYQKDESHPEDCFAVEFLDWGLQGARFCAKVQISEWCEVPIFDKE